MSSTFIQHNVTKIGSVGLSGPGIEGNTSLNVTSLMTLFWRIKILVISDLTADPQTSIAYIIWEYIKL